MPQEPLVIEDLPGVKEGERILRLTGPLTISNLFDFQAKVRADQSPGLFLDFTNVPYIDSAGIGALVGAYVNHQKDGWALYLVSVNRRVRDALQVTRVEQFFTFLDSAVAPTKTSASSSPCSGV
jgi:anti-sigma B factor antagonist